MKRNDENIIKIKRIQYIFLIVLGFLAFGAIGGGIVLIISPDGKLLGLPLSEFKWRLARLMVGVGAALGREKYTAATKNLPDSAKILSHGAFAVFRGSAKDFAEKSVRNRGFKQVLDKPELMKNIAKSLREQNSFTRDKLRE